MLPVLAVMAHEIGPGSSKAGLFGLKPEYVHVLLNPLPVYGLAIGLVVLCFGFIRRSQPVRTTGLVITALCAASAWPVLYYGQHAYNSLAPMLDTESEQWLDTHMERAERFIYFFYATAAFAIAALVFSRKSPKARTVLSALALALGVASLGLGAWISRAGGQASHSEFRADGASPPPSSGHTHGMHEESASQRAKEEEGKTEHPPHERAHNETEAPGNNPSHEHHAETNQIQSATSSTNATHEHVHPTSSSTPAPAVQSPAEAPGHAQEQPQRHAHTNAPTATGEWLPDTPEAIWTELHRHHDQLAAAVMARAFDQVHGHAVAIEKLVGALVAIVHPDHKAAVQRGADQIIAAVKAAHKSAHAEDAAGLESNFKLFEQSLDELEKQMKKQ